MKVCGVVSEFNPFHNGHRYLISQIKRMGFDAVVCVMSGNFVQRGEYAFCDKRIRAKSAISGGADLVVSLPFPWSSCTAEIFADCAVSILSRLGFVDSIAFGSECADMEKLRICSGFLSGISSNDVIEYQKLSPNVSFASAREKLVKKLLGTEYSALVSSPNDILALEYIKAIKKNDNRIIPIAIKRAGSNHNGEVFSENICSSSKIRSLYASNCPSDASEYISKEDADILATFSRSTNKAKFMDILRGAVLSREPEELSLFLEIGGGLEYAVYREILASKTFDDLLISLKSRHITDAKIRRALLFIATGVKKEHILNSSGFTEVLAMNEVGRMLLASARGNSDIIILSKTANIKCADELTTKQFKLQRKAEIIFEKISESYIF